MKSMTLLKIGSGLVFAAMLAACNSDKLTALNKNPNSPEDVPAGPIFTNAARVASSRWLGSGYSLRQTEWLSQHLAEVQYNDEDRYIRLHGGDTEGSFNGAYSGELKDFTQIINKGIASAAPGTYGPASVMRTWEFSYLTNTWGDVPYFTALVGDSTGGSLSPKYDAQKDIYTDMFAQLDKASKAMAAAGVTNSLGAADPIYAGNLLKWERFANSLRARLAMLVINVDPAMANTQLTAAFNAPGGVFQSNSDNAVFKWPGDGVYDNPWAVNFKTRDDHRMSNTIMSLLLGNSDPRLPIFAQPTPANSSVYAGSPNGISPARAAAGNYIVNASRPGAIFYSGKTAYGTFGGAGSSTPSYLMTYAEIAFIQAEAAQRGIGGLTSGQAAGFYNAAITASLAQWGVTSGNTTAFLAQPGIVYSSGNAGLVQIGQQKWLALFTDGGTAWAEWRRTCQPATIKPGVDASVGTVPRRFEYAVLEYTVNEANVTAAGTSLGGDTYAGRMYVDKSPTAAPTYVAGCGVR
ncbi:MAG: SusD/RagB family nutrient-binding outer membrane lipoprotein [Gemmatimonadaceae bacterium]